MGAQVMRHGIQHKLLYPRYMIYKTVRYYNVTTFKNKINVFDERAHNSR